MTEHRLPALVHPITPEMILEKQLSGHSVFGPSGAEMWMTCKASLIANFFAEDRQTYEAAEGTVGHSVGERWVKTDVRPDDLVGFVMEVNGHEIEITEEMLGYIEDYYDLCQKIGADADQVFVEQRGDYSRLTPIDHQGGTADFLALRWQHLDVIDLKYGKEVVFAEWNKQLMIYALCMFFEWDWLYNFQTITLHVSQPRVATGGDQWTCTREELLAFAEQVKAAAAEAWIPNQPRTPSTKGCRWCKVRHNCTALYFFLAESTDVFEDWTEAEFEECDVEIADEKLVTANELILDPLSVSPFPRQPDPRELTTAAMAKLLRYRKLMENFFNSIERELLDRAISREEDIPWWKIVEGRTLRRFVDDEDYIIDQLEKKGLKRQDLFVKKMLSPAGIEKLMHTKLKISTAKAKAFLEEQGLTVKPAGTKTLAPATDNRLALPKDGDVFETWPE